MKNETKVEIQKINLKIDDIKISLTMEQAKKLNETLQDLFGSKIVHEHHYDQYKYWWSPTIITSVSAGIAASEMSRGTTIKADIPYTLTATNSLDINL